MSIGAYRLRLKAFYDSGVSFSMEKFRELLRVEREARVGGREKHAERAGVNKTTRHSPACRRNTSASSSCSWTGCCTR